MPLLCYYNIRELNTRLDRSLSYKSESGKLVPFSEGGVSVKFKFIPYSGRFPMLIKVYDESQTIGNLKRLKTLMDEGIREFRFSPAAYALPIGYSLYNEDGSKIPNGNSKIKKPFLVFVFKEDYIKLEEIIQHDDYHAIIENRFLFNYGERFGLALKLYELYLSLENTQRNNPDCKQLQILHYDIKAENYILAKDTNQIYIVDLDQSGVFDILENDYLLTDEKRNLRFRPTADLRLYDTLFLPYEVVMTKEQSPVKSDDPLYWNQKERFSEIWMAWLLIFRLLTGLENPFFFSISQDHKKVYALIKSKGITDLFSRHAFSSGDFLNYLSNDAKKNEYINHIIAHYNKTLNPEIRKMMNEVFITGFFVFNIRPSFYDLSKRYSFSKSRL